MRHQTDDVALLVAESGNRLQRTVRIRVVCHFPGSVDVPEYDLPVLFQLSQLLGRGEIIAFAVRDWHPQHLMRAARECERRIALPPAKVHMLAPKLHPPFAEQRARPQTRLEENLEPVADAQYRS